MDEFRYFWSSNFTSEVGQILGYPYLQIATQAPFQQNPFEV